MTEQRSSYGYDSGSEALHLPSHAVAKFGYQSTRLCLSNDYSDGEAAALKKKKVGLLSLRFTLHQVFVQLAVIDLFLHDWSRYFKPIDYPRIGDPA